MKTQLIKRIFFACMLFAGMVSCTNTPKDEAKKVEVAKENVMEAQSDLDKARADSAKEYQAYKDASQLRIQENEKKITDLKEAIRQEKAETRSAHQKEIDQLDAQNAKMKVRMNEFKQDSKDAWEKFKVGFNNDMDKLGAAISSINLKTKKKD